MDRQAVAERLQPAVASHPALRLLVLHGSRTRGEQHDRSDWDFAYLGDDGLAHFALLNDLSKVLQTDDIDLVDLRTGSALLRFRVARDGWVLHERPAGTFLDFAVEAVVFWCDIEPVVRRAHAAVLAGLG